MAIRNRLRRLEEDNGPELCPERYCLHIIISELIRYSDGTEVRLGDPSPPLCDSCPHRDGDPIRRIEVVRQY